MLLISLSNLDTMGKNKKKYLIKVRRVGLINIDIGQNEWAEGLRKKIWNGVEDEV